ncbi:unnamed protein product, partial [Rotaria sordida]
MAIDEATSLPPTTDGLMNILSPVKNDNQLFNTLFPLSDNNRLI